MSQNLIIKFRDEILLTSDELVNFAPRDEYTELALRYSELAGYEYFSPKYIENNRKNWSAFAQLIQKISKETDAAPDYLFDNVDAYLPLSLLEEIKKPEKDGFRRFNNLPEATADKIPNLYNYFKISLPDGISNAQIADWLGELGTFLPDASTVARTKLGNVPLHFAPSLLAAVYLVGEPEEASVEPGHMEPPLNPALGNQHYLADMSIPLNTTRGQDVGLTILEVNGWDTTHGQLESASFPVVFPTDIIWQGSPSLTSLRQYPALSTHGTKILGVLRAKHGDSNPMPNGVDLCQGIVPNATIRLASCLSSLSLALPLRKQYDEASALLEIVNTSERGDIVLIEVAFNGQKYPVDVVPAMHDLIALARLKEITVVAAAGNKSLYLPIESNPASVGQPITQIVPVSLIDAVKPEHSQSFWMAYRQITDHLRTEMGDDFVEYDSPEDFIASYQANASAAILVGASRQPERVPRRQPRTIVATRKSTSSYGPRVNVYAQGENILSTTIEGKYYTTSDTSGASAIIAGFATLLQSQAKQDQYLIQPDEMRILLTQGTTVSNSVGGVIPDYGLASAMLSGWIADQNT
ncbi:S8 family serine peptidase [Fibrella aquatica]|jgi:Subtilase family|uniref:S8 family serine peptidase n=1 Tax=Fibrella aquatica TaxID=3242487 RepID=UPI0035221EDD